MASESKINDVARLLGDRMWISRLARRLATQDADDLVQDTWLAALRSPPDPERPARPWLARVLKNLAAMTARQRRKEVLMEPNELENFPPSGHRPASMDAELERAEALDLLAHAVLALEEPYRTVVLQRYLDEQDPKDIAAALGVPAGTVRWRINEGLRRMRGFVARIDRQQERLKRRRTAKALAPWVALRRPAFAPAWAKGKGIVMVINKTKLAVAAVCAVFAAIAIVEIAGGPSSDVQSSAEEGNRHTVSTPTVTPKQIANVFPAGVPPEEPLRSRLQPNTLQAGLPMFKQGHPDAPEAIGPSFADGSPSSELKPIAADAIATIMKSLIGDIAGCYEKLLEEQPGASGRVLVAFTIGSKSGVGTVTDATIVPPDSDNAEAGGGALPPHPLTELCFLQVLSKATFPDPGSDGHVVVRYPFIFSPGPNPMRASR